MTKNLRSGFTKILVSLAMVLFILSNVKVMDAQPSNYCVPDRTGIPSYYSYYLCYIDQYPQYNGFYHAYFTKVELVNNSSNEVSFERTSDNDGCYIFTEVEGEVSVGQSYDLNTTRIQSYYWGNYGMYNSVRCFIDFNIDGDFLDPGEMLYQGDYPDNDSWWGRVTANQEINYTFKFDVAADNPMGKARLRLMTSYYYPRYNYSYWNNPCMNGYYSTWRGGSSYNYGETEDYIVDFTLAVKSSFPDQNDILIAGENYNGETRTWRGDPYYYERPFVEFGSPQVAGTIMNYQIVGPLPSTNVVYTALSNSDDSDIDVGGSSATYTIYNSEGTSSPNGDGAFISQNGGVYRLDITINIPGAVERTVYRTFTVSWDNDMSTREISSPRTSQAPKFFKYLRGNTISVSGWFQNVGLNEVTEFDAAARIYDSNGDLFQEFSYNYDSNDPNVSPLAAGTKVEVDFGTVRIFDVGIYTIEMCSDLLSAVDQEEYNDCIPRSDGGDYEFEVTYEIQLMANRIINPPDGDILIGSRPIRPRAEFKNVGIGDASDVPAVMWVTDSNGDEVYRSDIIIQDIPSGKYNTITVEFARMELRESGIYTVCIEVSAEDDPIDDDNRLCTGFTVEAGLSGTYTVGITRPGSRNFETIDDAMNALYLRGLAGSAVFEFTDANYSVTSDVADYPAWDFGSRIIGLGPDAETGEINSITWRASNARSLQRGGVTITMNTSSGVGVRFGQTVNPANQYAIYNSFNDISNANSAGYINFDGGNQRSLRFVINSGSAGFAAPFFLGAGTNNISIQRCLIENGNLNLACKSTLPLITYDPQLGFVFQPDTSIVGNFVDGYSAGIVIRPIILPLIETGFQSLDTLVAMNNTITGNEISDFGYGVVSLGYGPLFLNGHAQWKRFYNEGNLVQGNTIYDVCRAGVFMGYEENSSVIGNRIYNVGGSNEVAAAGVIIGGQSQGELLGYNNIGINVSGNEISGLTSNAKLAGILIEQTRTSYQDAIETVVHFPNVDENMHITNNVIWGFTPTSADADRAGIMIYTERDPNGGYTDARFPEYWTTGDQVVNNTIFVNSDGGLINTGELTGIGISHSNNTQIINNAIAILDNDLDLSSNVAAGIFYQGHEIANVDGLISDRNAIWFDNSRSNAAVYRYVEMEGDAVVEMGSRNEFTSIDQWQLWTGSDQNSVFGNFTQDLSYQGSSPQSLRINQDPEPPLGSILDNRGDRISWLEDDIDENLRGSAGQRYDIGAEEFNGRMYVMDLEVVGIPTPGNYKSSNGQFSDAEYVMTKAPVEITTRIRNNGSLQANGIEVTVRVYLENPDGNFEATPAFTETITTDIPSTESVDASFFLADGMNFDWMPQTFGDLRGSVPAYTVPNRFSTMEANVTPRYRIDISIESDQQNANNTGSKVVRFYLERSDLRLIVSAENSMTVGSTDQDELAGNLNYDAVMTGLFNTDWYNDINAGRVNIDVFDRLGWEPRAVNYSNYRTMFWSDGDDKPMTRQQIIDIQDYLAIGSPAEKRSLLTGSQEMVREANGNDFSMNTLRAVNVDPGNPMGLGISNDGNSVIGMRVSRDHERFIAATGVANDAEPYCGLMSVQGVGPGIAGVAFNYTTTDPSISETTMGVSTTTLAINVVHLGVDWRHFADMEDIVRGLFDYVEQHGGVIVPVELLSFDADRIGSEVALTWTTATEYNSSRFDVEKALEGSGFAKINEVQAAGNSSVDNDYGPIFDSDVEMGNTYVYRLKMIDLDGEFDYSPERVVTMTSEGGVIVLSDVYPMPATADSKVDYFVSGSQEVVIDMFDIRGNKVAELVNAMASGSKILNLELDGLSSGSYTIVLRAGDVTLTRSFNYVK